MFGVEFVYQCVELFQCYVYLCVVFYIQVDEVVVFFCFGNDVVGIGQVEVFVVFIFVLVYVVQFDVDVRFDVGSVCGFDQFDYVVGKFGVFGWVVDKFVEQVKVFGDVVMFKCLYGLDSVFNVFVGYELFGEILYFLMGELFYLWLFGDGQDGFVVKLVNYVGFFGEGERKGRSQVRGER